MKDKEHEPLDDGTRQERREKKLESKRKRIAKHGKNLASFYNEAILKQITHLKENKEKRKKL